jgi:hypothetical protein
LAWFFLLHIEFLLTFNNSTQKSVEKDVVVGIDAESPGGFREVKDTGNLEITKKTKAKEIKGSEGTAKKRIRIVDLATGNKHDVAVKGKLIKAGNVGPKKLGWLEAKRYTWIKVKVKNQEYFAKVNIGSLSKRLDINPEYLTSTDNRFDSINSEVSSAIDHLTFNVTRFFNEKLKTLNRELANPSSFKVGKKQLFIQFRALKKVIEKCFAKRETPKELSTQIEELDKQSTTFKERREIVDRLEAGVRNGIVPLNVDRTTSEFVSLNRNFTSSPGEYRFDLSKPKGRDDFLKVVEGKISAYKFKKDTPQGLSDDDKKELKELKEDMSTFLMMIRSPRDCGYTQTPLMNQLARSDFSGELNKIVGSINRLNFQVQQASR